MAANPALAQDVQEVGHVGDLARFRAVKVVGAFLWLSEEAK